MAKLPVWRRIVVVYAERIAALIKVISNYYALRQGWQYKEDPPKEDDALEGTL